MRLNVTLTQQVEMFDDSSRGSLGVFRNEDLDFQPRRIFWITGVAPGQVRARHWHKIERQFILVATGELEVALENREGRFRRRISPGVGMYLPQDTWIELSNFANGTVAIVLCSEDYDPSDCYSDYEQFLHCVLKS